MVEQNRISFAAAASGSQQSSRVQFSSEETGLPGGRDFTMQQQPANKIELPLATGPPVLSIMPAQATEEEADTGPPLDENQHRYVGLVNQAMTCYLNSLIQTLYMTPEFRNALYKWEYKPVGNSKGGEETNIPAQLQKLFLLLQTSTKTALETKELTTSFGWNSQEAYDQHDVQELCRLMFDALEYRWKKTPHEKLIEDLYRGTMQDFVKCLACGKESVKKDVFLDLPLAVKQFGAMHAFKSVEEALSAFVQPEVLDGNNQYHCETCNGKQDAHKGLRITQFPYLLTMQLKRFDFDYNTLHRIKLNDRMSFPDVLDLNGFVYDESKPSCPAGATREESDASEKEGEGEKEEGKEPEVMVGRPLDRSRVDQLLKKGPYVYELFSVMVHQGSAAGGHYYAYIKNMDQDRWYCFNDSRVEPASAAEVEKTFGGSSGGWSTSNTNAYMLMYRQVEKERNQPFIRTASLPAHIASLESRWKAREEEKRKEQERLASMVKVTIVLNAIHRVDGLHDAHLKAELPRQHTLKDLYELSFRHFAEEGKKHGVQFTRQNSRLVRCSSLQLEMVQAFQSKGDMATKIESLLPVYNGQYRTDPLIFMFDVKPTGIMFPVVHQGGRTMRIVPVDIMENRVCPPFFMSVGPQETTLVVRKNLVSLLGDAKDEAVKYRLFAERTRNSYMDETMLCVDTSVDTYKRTMHDVLSTIVANVPTIFVDGGNGRCVCVEVEEDRKREMRDSRLLAVIDRKRHGVCLKLKLPTQEELDRSKATSTYRILTSSSCPPVPESAEPSEGGMGGEGGGEGGGESGRQSSVSSRSGGMDVEDVVMFSSGSGSMCNNTPQMSPNVSENGDAFIDEDDQMRISENLAASIEHAMEGARWPVGSMTGMEVEGGGGGETASMADAASTAGGVSSSRSSGGTLVPGGAWQEEVQAVRVEREEDGGNTLFVNVDSRMEVRGVKAWIGGRIGVEPAMFVLVKHHKEEADDKGYECTGRDSDSVGACFSTVSRLSINLRPPLKDNEKMVNVCRFDPQEAERERMEVLFELAVSKDTLVCDLADAIRHQYHHKTGTLLQKGQFRLRDMTSPRPVLSMDDRLEARGNNWGNNVYLHIIDESLVGVPGQPVFVRRFRPSTVEVGPIQEVLILPSERDQVECLRSQISHISGIPHNRVEMTQITLSPWDKWPYARARLDLLEGGAKFAAYMPNLETGELLDKAGSRVVYYRDSAEDAKELSEEEKKQIRIRDAGAASTTQQRRRERPLRIQMSSISEP